MESKDHLFFDCSFSIEVWGAVLQLCGLNKSILGWNVELEWAIRRLKGKSLISVMLWLAWRTSREREREREEWKAEWSECNNTKLDCATH